MSFKDDIQEDIKTIFLNSDEFGEVHTVDGKEMVIIVDENELAEREAKVKTMAEGLHNKQLLIYVSKKDFGSEPLIDRLLELDGNYYTVTNVSNEMGIYAISLEENAS